MGGKTGGDHRMKIYRGESSGHQKITPLDTIYIYISSPLLHAFFLMRHKKILMPQYPFNFLGSVACIDCVEGSFGIRIFFGCIIGLVFVNISVKMNRHVKLRRKEITAI